MAHRVLRHHVQHKQCRRLEIPTFTNKDDAGPESLVPRGQGHEDSMRATCFETGTAERSARAQKFWGNSRHTIRSAVVVSAQQKDSTKAVIP